MTTSAACSRAKSGRAAARRSGRSRRRRGARPTAGRPAAGSRRRPRARGIAGASPASSRPATITPPAARADVVREPHGFRRAAFTVEPRAPAGAPAGGRRAGVFRDQRLAQRPVQVHGSGALAARERARAAGQRADPGDPLGRRLVVADLEEPAHGVAVELDLVDRLPGADLAQLRRAVGGQHDQRDPRLARLDHGRGEVGRGGPRGAGERDRPPGRLRDAQGEEAARALVDVRVRAKPRLAGERQHERRRARPGEVQASVMPQRASSSTNAAIRSWVSVAASRCGVARDRANRPAARRRDATASHWSRGDPVVLLHGFAGRRHWDRDRPTCPSGMAAALPRRRRSLSRPTASRTTSRLSAEPAVPRSSATRWAAGLHCTSRSRPRADRAAGARLDERRHRRSTAPSAARRARGRGVWPTEIERRLDRGVHLALARRSRCSLGTPPGSPRRRGADQRRQHAGGWRRCCAASAPARWRRCGSGWAS